MNYLILGATNPSGVEWGTVVSTLVTFLILLFLLRKFAWGPLKGIMDERQNSINADIDHAAKENQEAQRLANENKALLNQTQTEVQTILENAKTQAKHEHEAILHEANTRANQLLVDAQSEIESEKKRAIADINDRVAELSVLIASKVINKEINEKDQKDLVQQYIQEAGDK